MLNGIILKYRIWHYLRHTLTKPQKKLGGMSICPFLKQYIDSIEVVITQNWEVKINQVCDLFKAFDWEAIVIGGPIIDYDELMEMVDYANSMYGKKGLEILLMHPDTDQAPLPLEYNFKHSPLVIVQNKKTLNASRKLLKKNGRYYKYHK